jgi:hypothetical protein
LRHLECRFGFLGAVFEIELLRKDIHKAKYS